MVRQVVKCINYVQYLVLVNSHEVGPTYPKRGLSWVDPLSPYLFVLCVEIFIREKLLRSVEINLTFDFGIVISVCYIKSANAFEVATWERVKAIKPNFSLKETREEDELWLLSSFLRER